MDLAGKSVAVLSVLFCAVLSGCASSRPAESQVVSVECVRQMLRQSIKDEANDEARWTLGGWKIGLALGGDRPWRPFFPFTYARDRLVSNGNVVVTPILAILADPSEKHDMVSAAAWALVYFDDPRILKAYVAAARQGRISDLDRLLSFHTPRYTEHPLEWADAHPKYDDLCLAGLDWYMTKRFPTPGEPHEFPSEIAMRWLNRIYDRDLDEWLAEKAPDALRYRNACLAKGYDPLFAFPELDPAVGRLDEAVRQGMFPNKSDLVAFRHLFEAVGTDSSNQARMAREVAGWKDRLGAWYWANRSQLIYDFTRHRFVVRGEQASGPTTRP